jgi:hypothetical protein
MARGVVVDVGVVWALFPLGARFLRLLEVVLLLPISSSSESDSYITSFDMPFVAELTVAGWTGTGGRAWTEGEGVLVPGCETEGAMSRGFVLLEVDIWPGERGREAVPVPVVVPEVEVAGRLGVCWKARAGVRLAEGPKWSCRSRAHTPNCSAVIRRPTLLA